MVSQVTAPVALALVDMLAVMVYICELEVQVTSTLTAVGVMEREV